jgi:hypothetical protein
VYFLSKVKKIWRAKQQLILKDWQKLLKYVCLFFVLIF